MTFLARALASWGFIALVASACGGGVDPLSETGGDPSGAVTEPPDPTGPPPGVGMAACRPDVQTSSPAYTTRADLLARFPGVWLACQPPDKDDIPSGPSGFEVTPQGHLYRLTADAQGRIIRKHGFHNEAALVVVGDDSMGFVPYFDTYGTEQVESSSRLSRDGNTLELQIYPTSDLRFARGRTAALEPTPPPAGAQGAAGCGMNETDIDMSSAEDVHASLQGDYVICSAAGISAVPAGVTGFRVEGDTWHFLYGDKLSFAPFEYGTIRVVPETLGGTVSTMLAWLLSSKNEPLDTSVAVSKAPAKVALHALNNGWTIFSKMP